ncbi:protein LURP-one-related 12-like [Coffea arabica]|uniref:Protein LURP-one-related 12-like n=1 Tax=Coffea arabica TaxID=13443 RepID=A0A6P6SVI7_COFAR|nr:protein LURP-one-related 12-like isoform X2 [Coffea arabica]XP_027069973.1 protein LURP-one-related 12-like isoform X2 [Coffea arabica]
MSSRSPIVEKIFCFEEETHLTVHKTSIFVPGGGDGFIVYNPTWEMTFRVDSYGPDSASKDELVLMDSSGKSLVTLLRKGMIEDFEFDFIADGITSLVGGNRVVLEVG